MRTTFLLGIPRPTLRPGLHGAGVVDAPRQHMGTHFTVPCVAISLASLGSEFLLEQLPFPPPKELVGQ